MEENSTVYERTHVLGGLLYTTSSISFLAIYGVILVIILKTEELWHNPAYKLIFHLGLADQLQLLSHFWAGVLLLSECSCGGFKNLIGSVANCAWFVYLPLTTILALNRCVVFSSTLDEDVWFSNRNTLAMITFCWLIGVVYLIGNQTPLYTFSFAPEPYMHMYGYIVDVSGHAYTIENMILYSVLGVSALCYVLAFINLRQLVGTGGGDTSEMRAHKRLALQTLLVLCSMAFTMVLWTVTLQDFDNIEYTSIFATMTWIGNCGVNAMIYLSLNKSIKAKFLACCAGQAAQVAPQSQNTRSRGAATSRA